MNLWAYIESRKWKVAGLLLITLCSLLSPSAVFSAFEDKGTGARGTALGDTYVVLADDVLALAYNPASLARVQRKEVTSEYAKLFGGLSDGSNLTQSYLAYGQPVRWGGTLAASWKQFALDDLYKERTLTLGYGEWLTPRIAIGGALKQLYHEFGVPTMIVDNNGNVQNGTPAFFARNGNSNTAYGADLGMLYRWTDRHTLGISIQDINEPNIALSPSDHEIVPRTFRMGLSYERSRNLVFAGALQTRQTLSNQRDTILTGSAERSWSLEGGDRAFARGSLANGSRELRQLALGGGYQMGDLSFDYAFVFNITGISIGETSGTHRFSLTYRFGPKGLPAKAPRSARQKQPKQPKVRPMPEGYEHTSQDGSIPAEPVRTLPASRTLPREAEITITPEDLEPELSPTQAKSAEVTIDLIFDTDFDGITDEFDRCPDTPAGSSVDAQGCAPSQVSPAGHPLPHRVEVEFITLEEVENGR